MVFFILLPCPTRCLNSLIFGNNWNCKRRASGCGDRDTSRIHIRPTPGSTPPHPNPSSTQFSSHSFINTTVPSIFISSPSTQHAFEIPPQPALSHSSHPSYPLRPQKPHMVIHPFIQPQTTPGTSQKDSRTHGCYICA